MGGEAPASPDGPDPVVVMDEVSVKVLVENHLRRLRKTANVHAH